MCNACRAKVRCTDSDRGREVVRPLDPWPHSEAGRFHRVAALLLLAAAMLVLAAEAARHRSAAEAALLLGLLLVTALAARSLLRDLHGHPASFPSPAPSDGVRFAGGTDEAPRTPTA